jgi:dCTP diphosphatase
MTPDYAMLADLVEQMRQFNEERDWDRLDNPKDLAISMNVAAAELLEHFQWKTPEALAQYMADHKDDVADELAGTFWYLLLLADKYGIDIVNALKSKLAKNETKYPVQTVLKFQRSKGQFGKTTDI